MEKNIKHHALAALAEGKQKIIPSEHEVGWVQHAPGLRRGREIHAAQGNWSSVPPLAGLTDWAAANLISRLPVYLKSPVTHIDCWCLVTSTLCCSPSTSWGVSAFRNMATFFSSSVSLLVGLNWNFALLPFYRKC
jgi:hypothetical protein